MPEQAKQMATYFAMFYASINMGSMISTIVIPYLRYTYPAWPQTTMSRQLLVLLGFIVK